LAVLALPVRGEVGNAPGPEFQIEYSNPGLTPAHWTLMLHPDGSGHFRSERGDAPGDGLEGRVRRIEIPDVDREIRLSTEFVEHIFQTARLHKQSSTECESHMKVAFQGWKKLRLTGPDGEWGCEFNYSKDKEIQALGESLLAVAGTILEGARIEVLLRHDRLGLDSETEYLVAAAGDGRLQQIGVIRETLERLADDSTVMERVRKRARALLEGAGNGDHGRGAGGK
jgi:hypothetical protein